MERIDQNHAAISPHCPFEGALLKETWGYYRVLLTWTSNALEGNTLTELETKVLLEDGLTAGGKLLRDVFEAVGHARAYDFMFSLLDSGRISAQDVLSLHRLFYDRIDPDQAGRYREQPVIITGSRHPVSDWRTIPKEMAELVQWADREQDRYHPVEFAAQLHKRFAFIHPFVGGNGRVARLLMNTALMQKGYLPAVIPPVLRQEYIALLERAHEDDEPFTEFIAQRVLDSQKIMMRLLHIRPQGPKIKEPTM